MSELPTGESPSRADAAPPWCAGCGHYGGLAALSEVRTASNVAEEMWSFVSGPGCAGRLPEGLRGYRLEVPSGSALAAAAGLRWARPELTVVAVTGDSDGFGAGVAGLAAVAPTRPKLLWIVLDNELGAADGSRRRSARAARGAALAMAAGVSFVARGLASDLAGSSALLKQGLERPGISLVMLASGCVAMHRPDADRELRSRAQAIPREHRTTDAAAASALLADPAHLWTGVLYADDRTDS
ncbi:MAG: hypothetical protein JNJ88_07780 [Planctomycetes bacterium]|nr:hypothetical protein [Planctomycetota bacterium]